MMSGHFSTINSLVFPHSRFYKGMTRLREHSLAITLGHNICGVPDNARVMNDFAPFSLLKKTLERRPITYSPGIKVPRWSNRKQRSEYHQMLLRIGPLPNHKFRRRFLLFSKSGFGMPLGNEASGLWCRYTKSVFTPLCFNL